MQPRRGHVSDLCLKVKFIYIHNFSYHEHSVIHVYDNVLYHEQIISFSHFHEELIN